jgi:16S rRNA (cytosine1402-N4)-methyltransferase
MLDIAAHQLSGLSSRLVQASYAELPQVLARLAVPAVDRILLDLGLSSDQLADESRGFSFSSAGPLDLRFDPTHGEPASALLARLGEEQLAEIFERYGQEPHSRRIARNLVSLRSRQAIRTARDLADAVAGAGDKASSRGGKRLGARHPATRVLQALRIAVNNELEQLEIAIQGGLYQCLKPGGIAVVISFHSLEDRLVKQAFRESNSWQRLIPKPITASPAERRFNPRSRSARLRAAKKLPEPKQN